MRYSETKIENRCPREEIGLFLDGELLPNEMVQLERHLKECSVCFDELNLQKQMLSALDFAFDKKTEIELPKDFTKMVITKAESGVYGLRSKKERVRAFWIILPLLFLIVLAIFAESGSFFPSIKTFGSQILAITSFLVHLAFDISIGIAVILRSLSEQIFGSFYFILILLGIVFSLLLLKFPRFVYRISRPKTS